MKLFEITFTRFSTTSKGTIYNAATFSVTYEATSAAGAIEQFNADAKRWYEIFGEHYERARVQYHGKK